MSLLGSALVGWTVLCLAVVIVAERSAWRRGVWVFKPLASAGFVSLALVCGAWDSRYGRAVLGALILSMAGDVLLIPRERPAVFRLGIVAFLLGHVAYVAAFVIRGVNPTWAAVALVGVAVVAVGVLRWLRPHIPPSFRVPVVAYVLVISVMLAAAAGTRGAGHPVALLAGAFLFYVSDLAVARERFVRREFINRLGGLPLYYAAQMLLAATV